MQEITQVSYGNGTVTVTMNVESATEVAASAVRFGDYYEAVEASFTVKELEEITQGAHAQLDFNYVMRDELTDDEVIKHFDEGMKRAEKLTGKLHEGVYFEVEATKAVGGEEADVLDTLYTDIEFQYELPLYLISSDYSYYAMTDVKGVCDLEEDIDEDADTLSINTHNVGTTLIVYQEKKEKNGENEPGFTVKSQYVFILGIFALALAWWALDKKYRK